MRCPDCDGDGYVMQDVGTALIPDYIAIPCRSCNPLATDDDAPDWDNVPGTAYDDFHRFSDAHYNGL